MATISEIIGSRMKSADDGFVKRRMEEYRRRMEESVAVPQDGSDIFELIRKGKYDKAVEMARSRKLNPFSLFNGVSVFGRTYDNMPFVAAALASAADKRSKSETAGDRMSKVLGEVLSRCGAVSSNMFDAKFTTPSGSDDILTFVLTRDGQLKPSKKYDGELDLDTLVLLHSILDGGYSLTNTGGLLKYVFDNDLISTLRFMVDSGLYTPSMETVSAYGTDPNSNVGRMVSLVARHPFAFHSPEIERDDKGKFAGGTLYEALKRVGYDISDFEDAQEVHPSVVWMVKDAATDAYVRYSNAGENFSSGCCDCLAEGSEFAEAVERLLYLCAEYRKFINGSDGYSDADRERYLRELVRSANDGLLRLNNGFNSALESLSLPKVTLVLKNGVADGDADVRFKTAPFMKEIWDSVKIGRKRRVPAHS